MLNNTYIETFIETFENFTKPQYEEIKLLILSDESNGNNVLFNFCLLYTSPSPRDRTRSRMPSSA